MILIFCTSCNGQVKKDLPKEKVSDSKITADGQPKLIKTQGSQKGDNVHCSLQDKAGNLWFGTTGEGVYKYDGKSFTNMTSKVSSARFFSVLEDRKGNFWFASIGSGVYYYNGKSFRNFTTRDGLANDRVTNIYEDKTGNVWFGTESGASRYDPSAALRTGGKSFI